MTFRFRSCSKLAGVLWLVFSAISPAAKAQATYTASRLAEIQAFVGYTYTTPDYSHYKDSGVAFGADYVRYNHTRWTPALEFRANINSGPIINEHSYLGGIRVHTDLKGRYHPYVNVLAGLGIAEYPVPHGSGTAATTTEADDHGLAYSYGVGMDIDIAHNFMLKADGQQQQWNLGQNEFTAPGHANFTLGPVVMTVGVVYRIPFHPWTAHGHETN